MKKILIILSFLWAIHLNAAVGNGESAPNFSLTDLDGNEVSLDDFAGQTVVLEWINTGCPFVGKFYSEGHMPEFQRKAASMGVVWLTINSTKPSHPQYIDAGTSRTWASDKGHSATWLMDPEGKVGQAYGARTTPHMFVIDPAGRVVYQGAIDSVRDADPASIPDATNYVMEAVKALRANKPIEVAQTRPYGCGIKY